MLRIFILIILAIVPLDLSTSKQYYLVFLLRAEVGIPTYFEFQSVKRKLIYEYNDALHHIKATRPWLQFLYSYIIYLEVCFIMQYQAHVKLQDELSNDSVYS